MKSLEDRVRTTVSRSTWLAINGASQTELVREIDKLAGMIEELLTLINQSKPTTSSVETDSYSYERIGGLDVVTQKAGRQDQAKPDLSDQEMTACRLSRAARKATETLAHAKNEPLKAAEGLLATVNQASLLAPSEIQSELAVCAAGLKSAVHPQSGKTDISRLITALEETANAAERYSRELYPDHDCLQLGVNRPHHG